MSLVTEAQVIAKNAMHQGLDKRNITPHILPVQQIDLSNAITPEFYAEIVEGGHVDSDGNVTATGDLLVLIRDYIQPFLMYAIGAMSVNPSHNQYTNKGIQRFDGVNSRPASGNAKKSVKGGMHALALAYRRKLKKYLEENSSKTAFATYNTGTKEDSGATAMFNVFGIV